MARLQRDSAIEVAAEAAHEANRVYCFAIGDDSQLAWDRAPAWQRESALSGVRTIADNPELAPSAIHERWRRHKRREGWSYGLVKDEHKKTHPCMVPYEELPPAQRYKDKIFGAVVRGVLLHHRVIGE